MGDLAHLSAAAGIGGSIKSSPEDFLVEEISPYAGQLSLNAQVQKEGSGKYCHFILQKRALTTTEALVQISRSLCIAKDRLSVGGQKDKNAITVQLACAQGVEPASLLSLSPPGIKILGAWRSPSQLKIGDVTGNRFCIKWHGKKKADLQVQKICKGLNGVFPNYFGPQRFGMRGNTHKIGKYILQGKFRLAVLSYLTDTGEEREDFTNARKALAKSGDYAAALKSFPPPLAHERTLLSHLCDSPYDYVGALQKLPNKLPLLFVNAFQSHLFNECLSLRIKGKSCNELMDGEYFCAPNECGFPDVSRKSEKGFVVSRLLGYDSTPNAPEAQLLAREELSPSNFKVRSFPSLSVKSSPRTLLSPLANFSFKKDTFSFSLASGSYATSALREFMKN